MSWFSLVAEIECAVELREISEKPGDLIVTLWFLVMLTFRRIALPDSLDHSICSIRSLRDHRMRMMLLRPSVQYELQRCGHRLVILVRLFDLPFYGSLVNPRPRQPETATRVMTTMSVLTHTLDREAPLKLGRQGDRRQDLHLTVMTVAILRDIGGFEVKAAQPVTFSD